MNLEQILRAGTLRRALVVLALLSCLLMAAAGVVIERELRDRHQVRLDTFATELDRNLQSLRQQVRNLARNDLIINSLIDYTNRDSYLPVFFRSLELTVTESTSIVFTDFQGKIITGKNMDDFALSDAHFNWRGRVLGEAGDFMEYSEHGLLIASPVLYSNFAEGAIAVYIKNINSVVPDTGDNSFVILVDNNNNIIMSSDASAFAPGSRYEATGLDSWYSSSQSYGSNRLFKLEPLTSAYSEIVWLLAAVIIAVIAVLVGTVFAIRTSAKLAARSMRKLEQSISNAMEEGNEPGEIIHIDNEATEFRAIRQSFFVLMANLAATSISRDKVEAVINSLDEILIVVDNEHNPLIRNASYSQLCERLELRYENAMAELVPAELLQLTGVLNLTIEKSYLMPHKDGQSKEFILRWQRNDYLNNQGEKLGFIFTAQNVTQEKLLQSELQIKNQAVDEAATAIVLADARQPDMPLTYVNAAFEKMTGYQSNEVIGLNCRFLQGDDTPPEAVEALREAIREQRATTVTLLNHRKDGSTFYNELSITPIFDENGVLTHYLGIQVDVTAREQSAQYMLEAKEKAEESARLKSDFLATMSHEIRTPINGVMGMLNLLMGTDLDADQRHHAQLAKSSADSLLNIVNDVLDFSKVEAGKLNIEHVDIDLYQLFGATAESLAQTAQDKGIELIVDLAAIDHPRVQGDPGRIRQVLTNLIGNAIKFTESGSVLVRVHIEHNTTGDSSRLHCSVKDTGIGIPEQRLARIFEVFSQADSYTTRRYGGTGLGLSISKQLCELMGGDISVSSEQGKGSEFRFEVEVSPLSPAADYPSKLVSHDYLRALPVLVIDDNKDSQEAICGLLRKWQATPFCAQSVEAAQAVMAENDIALVLIDQFLANEDGVELGRQLRAQNPACKLVLMTDMAERRNAPYFRTMGFDYSFPKPAIVSDLQQSISVALGGDEHNTHDASNAVVPASANGEAQALTQRKHRVLLIEDNMTNQLVAKTLLESYGVDVDVAENGEIALNKLKAESARFSVVFMDCQMPVMDGFKCTSEIRSGSAGEHYRDVAIIAMTANAMQGDRERCIKAGMSDYISKPIDPNELQNKLEHWLDLVEHSGEELASPDLPQLEEKIWNRPLALERMMQREDLLLAVVSSFLDDLPPLVASLEQSIEQQDMAETKYYAHTLKGSASNLGGDHLAQIALDLEIAAKENKQAAVAKHWSDLQTAVQQLKKRLEQYLNSAQAAS